MQCHDPKAMKPGALPKRLVAAGCFGMREMHGLTRASGQSARLPKVRCSLPRPRRQNLFDTPPAHETAETVVKERFKKLLGTKYNLMVDLVAPIKSNAVCKFSGGGLSFPCKIVLGIPRIGRRDSVFSM
jgi:hypothetical protein